MFSISFHPACLPCLCSLSRRKLLVPACKGLCLFVWRVTPVIPEILFTSGRLQYCIYFLVHSKSCVFSRCWPCSPYWSSKACNIVLLKLHASIRQMCPSLVRRKTCFNIHCTHSQNACYLSMSWTPPNATYAIAPWPIPGAHFSCLHSERTPQ